MGRTVSERYWPSFDQSDRSKQPMVGKKLKSRKKSRRSKLNNVNSHKSKQSYFTLLGSNANGLLGRQDSLINSINIYQPSVIQIQETKVSRAGQIKIPSYQIYELVRKNGEGGCLLTAVHENVNSVCISGGDDEAEIMVVQADIDVDL